MRHSTKIPQNSIQFAPFGEIFDVDDQLKTLTRPTASVIYDAVTANRGNGVAHKRIIPLEMNSMPYFVLALLLAMFSFTASADGDIKQGEAKAAVCFACHGQQGNSQMPDWPKLAGQHAKYLVTQLRAFKDGSRKNPLMSPQAAALSEQDMQNLAAYFAAQSPK